MRVPERHAGDHVRLRGEDVHAGDIVAREGTRLGPFEVAMIAAVGRERVSCGGRPRVAVLVTGDELVEPGRPLAPGQIRDANAYGLAAQAELAGARLVHRELVPDDLEATVASLARALEVSDVVCVSGGVSVGAHDHVKAALARLGVAEVFWGIALKPGKPTWFGRRAERLVFGLPGNPVSAMVTFHLFTRPALERLGGVADPGPEQTVATLDEAVRRHPHRAQAIRCRLAPGPEGLLARPTGAQGSHLISSLLGAHALLQVSPGDGSVPAGEPVELELLG